MAVGMPAITFKFQPAEGGSGGKGTFFFFKEVVYITTVYII